ncbi:Protein of unknown function DUF3638 [Penicillium italicum]|uniref:ubiquitinyl hydrolase 1 n=1 Tax=Penicillium italicum TaxID=40296 RepID=A0A0A2L290_PENIT|nr:Protein of unknown function DUF3638 [Penicillium italicum]
MALILSDSVPYYPPLPFIEIDLWRRDRIRASSFCVAGFGAENHTSEYDQKYTALDSQHSPSTARVYSICKMLYDELPCVREIVVQDLVEHLWRVFSTTEIVHGQHTKIDISMIGYDASWILQTNDFILSYWCSIHRIIHSRRSGVNKFQLMIWLSTVAFSENSELFPLEIVAAIFLMGDIGPIYPPTRNYFRPSDGCGLDRDALRSQIHSAHRSHTPESTLERKGNENLAEFRSRRRSLMKLNRKSALDRVMRHFETQWPTRSPSSPDFNDHPRSTDYFDTTKMMLLVKKLFASWSNNRELRDYLTKLVTRISRETVHAISIPSYSNQLPPNPTRETRGFVTMNDLFGELPICHLKRPHLPMLFATSRMKNHCQSLSDFLGSLDLRAKSRFEKLYVQELRSSATSLQELDMEAQFVVDASEMEKEITDYLRACQLYYQGISTVIKSKIPSYNALIGFSRSAKPINDKVLETLACVNQLPRLSPMILLHQLSRYRWPQLSMGWRDWLCSYGRSITDLQRAKRLASLVGKDEELMRELQNPGYENWEPVNHPETLLLEIENGITIRNVQEDIARQIRDIKPGENAVMQLNMGEGKSSVIVPMVVAALANSSCLVRVVVAKPQSRQMLQTLVSRLGGLLGRRVYQMPISRSLKLEAPQANEILSMCQECMSKGGVLLIQPEHMLSLKLMCIESYIVGKKKAGQSLFQCLKFFHDYSRDIVDESDENFSVKFEQIYTMGAQTLVEFSPQRWTLIQQVLGVLQQYASGVMEEYPHSIEVEIQQSGAVPRIRLLRRDAEEALFDRVATHICNNGIDSLPISRQPKQVRDAVLKYVTKRDLTPDEIAAVEDRGNHSFWTDDTMNPLLLLRGLLAGGVLSFCFSKRWRVNYGPHRSRSPATKLCVPYRAKDNPSARSEFSHPDVIIILTSLHHYYAGLEDDDLVLAFKHLLDSDNATLEYQAWVQNAPALSPYFRQLICVNLEDRQNFTQNIFPALHASKGAVDYFLSRIVFPREMKTFPHKLSASGWDIGEVKKNPTVGFSGTNDGKQTLPLSIKQLSQARQNHTNALVLSYLLRAENSVVFEPDEVKPANSNAVFLLEMVSCLDPPAQVILDVGAQILELSNLEVAKHWLQTLPRDGPIKAIVFVDGDDEICVLDDKGVELLHNSPYARQIEVCYVFLDEAHTRGIDLKLPPSYRALVTLGHGITKDKLVQACMRMRKLGKGQSVIFYIPKDVQFKILALTGKSDKSAITVSDVLCWAVSETWAELRRSMPVWAIQGQRFERQQAIWDHNSVDDALEISQSQAESFLETECQSLQHRYRPGHGENSTLESSDNGNPNLRLISDRCHEFDGLEFDSSALQEEQERELAPEIEFERQVQRPPTMTPNEHRIHEDMWSFVSTGELKMLSSAYKPAFQSLSGTSIASGTDLGDFPGRLLVTEDFSQTVRVPKEDREARELMDSFQRPVRWILTSSSPSSTGKIRTATEMIIISPYEARCLLPAIRRSKTVVLHQYAPRQSSAFDSLDKLSLHSIPEDAGAIEIPDALRMELNLFSGQLFLESYSGYQRLCAFLGIASNAADDNLGAGAGRAREGSSSPFRQIPVKFLRDLMSQVRRDGQDIEKSHIGQMLNGLLLSPSDFVDPAEDW